MTWWSKLTGGLPVLAASSTRRSSSLCSGFSMRACDSATAENQLESGSWLNRPPHSSWPLDKVTTEGQHNMRRSTCGMGKGYMWKHICNMLFSFVLRLDLLPNIYRCNYHLSSLNTNPCLTMCTLVAPLFLLLITIWIIAFFAVQTNFGVAADRYQCHSNSS